MVSIENDCSQCAAPGYPCWGDQCTLSRMAIYICDECGDEVRAGELYKYDNQELCKYCVTDKIIEELEVVSL